MRFGTQWNFAMAWLCVSATPLLAAAAQDGSTSDQSPAPQPQEAAGHGKTDPAWTRFDFRRTVAQAKQRVFPSVVYIKCIRETHEQGKKALEEVAGSGVLISADGEVVTNWHVVDKATEVRCLLYDGRAAHADVLGTDKDTDLALLRLRETATGDSYPFAELSENTALTEGDFVMAMGAPWGMNRSVSIGIVSCARRFLPEQSEYSLWIQTDAAISPGNSGGPLVDTDGRIAGINTRGVLMGGDMGFAVPARTVTRVVEQLRATGEMQWSWTGLRLQPLRDFSRNIYFDEDHGVIVAATDPDSPARRAGVLPRDRIVRVGATPVTAVTEEGLPAIRRLLGTLPKGKPATLALVRGQTQLDIEMVPREKGKVEGEELDCPRWDFTAKAINQFDNPDLYFYRKEGVLVFALKHPGNAADAGLWPQDILLNIGGRTIGTLSDLEQAYNAAIANRKTKHKVMVSTLRNGMMHQNVLDFSRDYERE